MSSTRRTRAANDSSPSTRSAGPVGHGPGADWVAERVLDRLNQPIDAPNRHDAAVHTIVHQLRRAAGVGGDDRRFERHRLEHRVRRALVVRRLHEQVEGMMRAAARRR